MRFSCTRDCGAWCYGCSCHCHPASTRRAHANALAIHEAAQGKLAWPLYTPGKIAILRTRLARLIEGKR